LSKRIPGNLYCPDLEEGTRLLLFFGRSFIVVMPLCVMVLCVGAGSSGFVSEAYRAASIAAEQAIETILARVFLGYADNGAKSIQTLVNIVFFIFLHYFASLLASCQNMCEPIKNARKNCCRMR
jgi:hypothetical protein